MAHDARDSSAGDGIAESTTASASSRRIAVLPRGLRDVRVLRVLFQLVFVVGLLAIGAYLYDNYQANTDEGFLDFDFLDQPAGINIPYSDFRPGQPISDAMLVAVKNTALSAVVGIVVASAVGLIVGMARLSANWLVRKAATVYVEVLRNIPVLLIILFGDQVLKGLPQIGDPIELADWAVVTNREVATVSFVAGDGLATLLAIVALAALGGFGLASWRTRASERTGTRHHRLAWGGGLFVLVTTVGFVALDGPIELSHPETQRFGVTGGVSMGIAYAGLTAALAAYHGSHIAEIVRGSVQAVPHGQTEAAQSLGLSEFQRLRFVVLPQALRIAIPPTLNQYLSLTKNTSLGIAVAYLEITALTRTVIANGHPAVPAILMLMAIYLALSLTTSVVVNVVNGRFRVVET